MLVLGWLVKDSGSPVALVIAITLVCTAQLTMSLSGTMTRADRLISERHSRLADPVDA
jgi:hypothetical protein